MYVRINVLCKATLLSTTSTRKSNRGSSFSPRILIYLTRKSSYPQYRSVVVHRISCNVFKKYLSLQIIYPIFFFSISIIVYNNILFILYYIVIVTLNMWCDGSVLPPSLLPPVGCRPSDRSSFHILFYPDVTLWPVFIFNAVCCYSFSILLLLFLETIKK